MTAAQLAAAAAAEAGAAEQSAGGTVWVYGVRGAAATQAASRQQYIA